MKVKKIITSYSVLSQYKTCPTSFWRRYVQKLTPPQLNRIDRGSPLLFGRFVHQFLELYHGGVPANDAITAVLKDASDTPLLDVEAGGQRSLLHLELLLRAYVSRYPDPNSEFRVASVDSKQALELEVDTVLSENPLVVYRAHMDGIVLPNSGSTLILEHKTSGGNLYEDLVERMLPNDQAVGYVYGARRTLGLDVTGVLFNGLCTYRPLVNPGYRPKPGKKDQPLFSRRVVPIEAWMLEEWETETKRAIQRMIEDIEANSYGRNAPDSCTLWSSRCAYADLCKSAPKDRANLMDLGYTKESWKGFELGVE